MIKSVDQAIMTAMIELAQETTIERVMQSLAQQIYDALESQGLDLVLRDCSTLRTEKHRERMLVRSEKLATALLAQMLKLEK
jgi:hypothetical protein